MTFDEACRAILIDPGTNEFARSYARAGIGMTGEAARTQAIYIVCNINGWRGDTAKRVRAFLKTYNFD